MRKIKDCFTSKHSFKASQNMKNLKNIVKELIESESNVVSRCFKKAVNLEEPHLKERVFSIKNGQVVSLTEIEFDIQKNYEEFQILRNDINKLNFIPLVKKDNNDIKFLTAISYDGNQIESIFSIDFLNRSDLKNAITTNLYSNGFGLRIYIENDNYRTLGINSDGKEEIKIPIDTKSFMAKPLKDLPQSFDKIQKHITPSDLKEMQQSIPRDMLNKGKF